MTQLDIDLSCNRIQLRESHSRLLRDLAGLMEHKEIRGAEVASPLWSAVLQMRATYDEARNVERRALALLERAADRLEESKP